MKKETAWKWISENEERIVEISDKIWEFAELGLLEFKSSELLAQTLEESGFEVQRGIAGMPTAFVASYGSGHPIIGIMGEYDALPGLSQKPVPHREPFQEGAPGHGCGHNIHGTSGMAAAVALRLSMEKHGTKGTIRFFGSPAEENYDGKVYLVRAGFFDDVDAALSHHPYWENHAGLASNVAMNSIKFHFQGVAAHAATSPHQGRSALDAVELMNIGVNFMREHVISEARIHYVIEDGGRQPNIVPSSASSWYYVRAPERIQVDQIYQWILKIAQGADLMARTSHKVEFIGGLSNKIPNRGLSELVTANMREIGAPKYSQEELLFAKEIAKTINPDEKRDTLKIAKRPDWESLMEVILDQSILDAYNEGEIRPGSTDVADVCWVTPTMEFSTATWAVGTPTHSWQAVAQSGMGIGHKSLIFAAKTIAGTACDLLSKPGILKLIKDEFKERMKGKVYKCPIPDDVDPPLEVAKAQARAQKIS